VLVAGIILGIFLFAWRLRAARFGREQARQRAFAQQILAYQEIERKRIAGELHDDLGQRLSVIRNLALLANRTGNGEREGQIHIIADEVSQTIAEVRQISHNLRPYQLDMLGLTKAIEALVTKTCDAAGIRFEIVADDLCGAFPKEAEIHFYRVVQECLHNITRHSRATAATVLIQHTTAGTSLVISDNGVGFDASSGGSHGFGITGILERAQLLGGRARFESTAGHGTTVIIEINHNN
jgi:signal transduction histidine kinase